MGNKSNSDELLDYLPSLKKWYNLVGLFVIQILIFIGVMAFFWWIGSRYWFGAILGQAIVSMLLSIFFIYLANNAEKIREKYREKYKDLAGQRFWYCYQSYTIPVISAAYYIPIALINYDFLPKLIAMPPHFLTNSLLPYYLSFPIGIFVIIVGFLMKRPSGGYGEIEDNYLPVVYPEKSRIINTGMYRIIRNPQYLARGIISTGFGIIANNISAIIIGLTHLVSYCAIIPAEDKELIRRFGDDFKNYKKRVPAVFPKFSNWGDFSRFIFIRRKSNKF